MSSGRRRTYAFACKAGEWTSTCTGLAFIPGPAACPTERTDLTLAAIEQATWQVLARVGAFHGSGHKVFTYWVGPDTRQERVLLLDDRAVRVIRAIEQECVLAGRGKAV